MKDYKFCSAFDESECPCPTIEMFDGLPKEKYMKAGMLYEQVLALLIGQREDCDDFTYWIVADCEEVVAGIDSFDNATLVAEAFHCFSPYYCVIDVFCHSGLVWHEECNGGLAGRTSHIPASEWPDEVEKEERSVENSIEL